MAAQVTERQYQGQVHAVSRQLMSAWMEELGRAGAEGGAPGARMIPRELGEVPPRRLCGMAPTERCSGPWSRVEEGPPWSPWPAPSRS